MSEYDELVSEWVNSYEIVRSENERLSNALYQIRVWANAYPVTVFPEPDWTKAAEALRVNGMTLDAVSASNMRHVLDGVMRIVDEALGEAG